MNLSPTEASRASVRFQAALGSFQRAGNGRPEGILDRFYCIGGLRIRLRFAGPALLSRLTPALEHLAAVPCTDPDLTVCLWDSASTGVALPTPPTTSPEADIRDSAYHIHYAVSGVLSLLDLQQNLAVYWVAYAERLPYYECGAPLMAILHWWLGSKDRQVVHGAAVGTKEGGVLLAGKGGSGKSTTAKACLGSALLYAGDDYCAVQVSPEPHVHSLYSSGKVNAADIGRYPHLEPALSNRDRLPGEKALYFLAPHLPEALTPGFPLRAILLPRVTGNRDTSAVRISPAACLLALAPSTLFQLPGADSADFARLSTLVRQVPSYRLELGTDRSAIPAAILQVLAENG